ncbi:hypothetical protein [Kitasatospora arboriphila]|uniref:DUF2970 domain-containing protein n=1 Tax=Kitasatospora arboriphila TaxID=258052 RepID=A0ABN1U752_9ACTN
MRTTLAAARTTARAAALLAAACVRARRAELRKQPDGGYTTETVIITALLVGLGLGVLGIIAAKVTDKANGLTF